MEEKEKQNEILGNRMESLNTQDSFFSKVFKTAVIAGAVVAGGNKFGNDAVKSALKNDAVITGIVGLSANVASVMDGSYNKRDAYQNFALTMGFSTYAKFKGQGDFFRAMANEVVDSGRKLSLVAMDMTGNGKGNDYGPRSFATGVSNLLHQDYKGMFGAGKDEFLKSGNFINGVYNYVSSRSDSMQAYLKAKADGVIDLRKDISRAQKEFDIDLQGPYSKHANSFRQYRKVDNTFDMIGKIFNSRFINKSGDIDYAELERMNMTGNVKAIRSLYKDWKEEVGVSGTQLAEKIRNGEFDEYVKKTSKSLYEDTRSRDGLTIGEAYKEKGYKDYLSDKSSQIKVIRGKEVIVPNMNPIDDYELRAISNYNLTNTIVSKEVNGKRVLKDMSEGSRLFMAQGVIDMFEEVSNAVYRMPIIGHTYKQWNPIKKINETFNLSGIKSRMLNNVQFSYENVNKGIVEVDGVAKEYSTANKHIVTSSEYISVLGSGSNRKVNVESMKGAKVWDSSESLRSAYGYQSSEMRVSKDNLYRNYTYLNSSNQRVEANLFDMMFKKNIAETGSDGSVVKELSGISGRFEAFANSRYNRFRFRYEAGTGFRATKFEEDYNVESTIFDLKGNQRRRAERTAEINAVKQSIASKITKVGEAVGVKVKGNENYDDMLNDIRNIRASGNLNFMTKEMENNWNFLNQFSEEMKDFNKNKTSELNEFLLRTSKKIGVDATSKLYSAINENKELINALEEKSASIAISNAWQKFSDSTDMNMSQFFLKSEGIKAKINPEKVSELNLFEGLKYNAKRIINTRFSFGEMKNNMSSGEGLIDSFFDAFRVKNIDEEVISRNKDLDFITDSIRKNEVISQKYGDNIKTTSATSQENRYKNAMSFDNTHSNFIVGESTLSAFLEAKGVLEKVKLLVNHFSGKNERVTSVDMLFGQVATSLEQSLEGISMKRSYSGFMDSFTDADGNTTFRKSRNGYAGAYDIMKYLVLPTAMVATAYSWADKGTDAVISDDVPIFGGGITGALASVYGGARVGLQYGLKYTGVLPLLNMVNNVAPGTFDNPLTDVFDLMMDPEEMKDVYFNGKEIRVNKNRWWWTAGRGSGSGEDFGYFRKSLIYNAQHRDSGVYDNKLEKFFRKDFQPTSVMWYALNPYKEEVDAYQNLGVKYAKSEQLFEDIPVIGGLLNVTVGQIIKPTKYFWEHEWRMGEDLAINPHYNPEDPTSQKFVKFEEQNSFLNLNKAFFHAFEDLKTMAGIKGYMITMATKELFGKSNPYQDSNELRSVDDDYSVSKSYYDLEMGDLFGITEPFRRFLQEHDAVGQKNIDVTRANLPDWMSDKMRIGNIYANTPFARQSLDVKFDATSDIEKLKQLAMFDPYSKEFRTMKNKVANNVSDDEYADYLEAVSYSKNRDRNSIDRFGEEDLFNEYEGINFENAKYQDDGFFVSNGKRYKLTGIETDYNTLSRKAGATQAEETLKEIRDYINEGNFSALIETGSNSVQTDRDGQYQEVYIDSLQGIENYKMSRIGSGAVTSTVFKTAKLLQNATKGAYIEKIFGEKSAIDEWIQESVATPEFRDWRDPMSSFINPIRTLSSTGISGYMSMSNLAKTLDDSSDTMFFGLMNTTGGLNLLAGNTMWSDQYKEETQTLDYVEEMNAVAGERSIYTADENTSIYDLKKGLNASDAKYFEQLMNVRDVNDRDRILSVANDRMDRALQLVWNNQSQYVGEEGEFEIEEYEVPDDAPVEGYTSNNSLESMLYKKESWIDYNRIDEIKKAQLLNSTSKLRATDLAFIRDKIKNRYYNAKVKATSNLRDRGEIII